MKSGKTRIGIGRIGTNPTVRLIDTHMNKDYKDQSVHPDTVLCSELEDNKTTYMNKRAWDATVNKYRNPPYVDCDYVL